MDVHRRRSIGAEIVAGGVHFRVWAAIARTVSVVIAGRETPLERDRRGYFSGFVEGCGAGTLYAFRLDGGSDPFPDPASRYQPEGPHGPSMVVNASAFAWSDERWRGPRRRGNVIYEMHVGTFTPEGTWRAAIAQLKRLADLGITVIEMMPVNEFAGTFGWGYDGVALFAPTRLYGKPDDLRTFVDAAHALGLSVILDVVYNHLGPDGCYLSKFSPSYFTRKYENEWGEAINFDDEQSAPVREFFRENAAYWIDEFHFDGLRLDATQSMHDASRKHIICEITEAARAAAGEREVFLVGENEPQDVRMLDEYGLDALWNDDWHHAARVAATGRTEAYYTDYRGTPQEFVSMAKYGFLFQGQWYRWQKKRRGTPSRHIDAERLVIYLQNHDQVANSASGDRLDKLTSAARLRALTALMLLLPQTPMLFQGQEFGASAPFLYFADHKPDLAKLVASGRAEFLGQFPSVASRKVTSRLAAPHARETFERSKLDLRELERNAEIVALHRDLLKLRRDDPLFSAQDENAIDGAVIGEEAFALRWFGECGDDRLLVVNLGRDVYLDPAPEPLLAPPAEREWSMIWASEWPEYGGTGAAEVEVEGENWRIAAQSAVVLRSVVGALRS